jgi:hypothetical protein
MYGQAPAQRVFTPTVRVHTRSARGDQGGRMRAEPREVVLRLGDPRMSPIAKPSAIISRRRAKPSEVQTHHHTHADTQHHQQQNNIQHRVPTLQSGRQSGRGHTAQRGRHRLTPYRSRGNLGTRQFSDISSHTTVSGRRDSHDPRHHLSRSSDSVHTTTSTTSPPSPTPDLLPSSHIEET